MTPDKAEKIKHGTQKQINNLQLIVRARPDQKALVDVYAPDGLLKETFRAENTPAGTIEAAWAAAVAWATQTKDYKRKKTTP